MTNLAATLKRSFSLYSLLAVLIGSQAAVLTFVHHFGSPGADAVCGAILGGLAVLAVIAHGALSSVTIDVPSGTYAVLLRVNGAVVGVLAAGGIVAQYVGSVDPVLTPVVAVVLQGLALVASIFAGVFKADVADRQSVTAH